ncbi:predicted protein [Histoplasma capsulatum H143]|uniref:Uncharacterized protein n=1 Tax=Ajellomyces capsulatus (strain H143) TaxID=544712 RepID=C6H3J7_AJECH|nr:predicted protein [Histoplasma capsulatum H143]
MANSLLANKLKVARCDEKFLSLVDSFASASSLLTLPIPQDSPHGTKHPTRLDCDHIKVNPKTNQSDARQPPQGPQLPQRENPSHVIVVAPTKKKKENAFSGRCQHPLEPSSSADELSSPPDTWGLFQLGPHLFNTFQNAGWCQDRPCSFVMSAVRLSLCARDEEELDSAAMVSNLQHSPNIAHPAITTPRSQYMNNTFISLIFKLACGIYLVRIPGLISPASAVNGASVHCIDESMEANPVNPRADEAEDSYIM